MLRRLLVTGLVLVSVGSAQRNRGGSSGDPGGGMMAPGPSGKFETISNALNLNKEQKKAARTMLDDAAREAAPLRDQLSKARIAIADAVQSKKGDDEITQTANAYAALATRMTNLELKTFARIYATLDDTQKANKAGVGSVFTTMKNLFATRNWNED